MTIKILGCPICNSDKVEVRNGVGASPKGPYSDMFYWVHCGGCKLVGAICDRKEDAILAWNKGDFIRVKDSYDTDFGSIQICETVNLRQKGPK